MDEILEKYEVRKSNKEKTKFINYLIERLQKSNYSLNDISVEEKGFWIFKTRNIVVGNPETAKVIFCGHYDTCAVSPFPNIMSPTNPVLFIFSQFLLLFLMFLIATAVMVPLMLYVENPLVGMYAFEGTLFLLLIQLAFGIKNKHTANDNTSGVIALTHLLESLPLEQRAKVCVVFFDNEEKGLFGSFTFTHSHKNVAKNTLCVNIDCIGDGTEALTIANGKARKDPLYDVLTKALTDCSEDYDGRYFAKKMLPMMFPSDQANFKKGVGVCCLKRSIIGRHVMRLHTPFDTKCRKENIDFFVKGFIDFIRHI